MADLAAVARIQQASHGAAHWDPASYLTYDLKVAIVEDTIAGFIVSRCVAADEVEILNVAVDDAFRRRGVASKLIHSFPQTHIFLEVRESNLPARALYEKLGFVVVGRREKYYDDPVEAALVMRLSQSLIHVNV
jgi:Acetyltransferases